MIVPTYTIPPQSEEYKPFIKEGDTIYEFTITASADFDLTGASVNCQIYDKDGRLVLDLSTDNGGLSLEGQSLKFTEISASDNKLQSGTHKGDVQYTLSNGEVITPFNIEYVIQKEYTI